MSPIKDLNLTYQALNEQGTFSAGDTISGTVSFILTKDTKVKSVAVKAKGDAHVHWTEGTGDDKKTYTAHRRYFKEKEYCVAEKDSGTVLSKGPHQFKFNFRIPQEDMPSSFMGSSGRIVYLLEASISRSWRFPSSIQKELSFVSKSFPHIGQALCPQSGSVSKEVGTFSKGQVNLSATVNKKACYPGDTLSAFANISNNSTKDVTSKFNLVQKTVYRAGGNTNVVQKSLFKSVGDVIHPNTEATASCQVKIPDDAIYTVHNCEIISIEYYLKAYVDISFSFDPEVVFPLVLVPSSVLAFYTAEPMGPYQPAAVGGQSYSDFPPPAFPMGPNPVPIGPGACQYPPHPTQQVNMTSGYNNQWPQQTTPYGFPPAAFPPAAYPPSSVQPAAPTAPTAPPQFPQGEDPPPYMALYPPAHDFLGSSGPDQKS
ncbi:arrestin domain-containing protein 3-like [Amphiprion ocellaris]|uniref:arrestin domain-containing protein 3-like n=1 Tax=Amphiprion ocellaris TaxID=80972 RepID=UPI000C305B00|nr:arrestin domain-containing protein 3-like [Amphiprion ocellaris]